MLPELTAFGYKSVHVSKRVLFLDLVLSIFRLNGLLIAEGDAMTEKLGLTHARWKVIGAVALSQNGLTVPGIARVLGQSRQAVQRITDVMVKDGPWSTRKIQSTKGLSWCYLVIMERTYTALFERFRTLGL